MEKSAFNITKVGRVQAPLSDLYICHLHTGLDIQNVDKLTLRILVICNFRRVRPGKTLRQNERTSENPRTEWKDQGKPQDRMKGPENPKTEWKDQGKP